MDKAILLDRLLAIKPSLQSESVVHLAVFGSRARGDQRPDSDIDIAVDVAPDSDFSLLNLIGVEHIISDATGLSANAFMRRNLQDDFRQTLEREAVEIF